MTARARRGLPRRACLLSALAACSPAVEDPWAQLQPDSPCLQVELQDGVGDAVELRRLFDCLDRHGHLESLRPTVDALSSDEEAGLESLVRAADAASGPLGTLSLPSTSSLPDPAVQELLLEALSGIPGDVVGGAPGAPHEAPWSAIGPSTEALVVDLEDQPTAVAGLAAIVRHESLEEALVATVRSRGEPQGPFVAPLLHHLAAAGLEGDPEGEATQAWLDSWVVDPLGALPRSFFSLQLLTAEPGWRSEVVGHIAAHDDLGDVPRAVAWLASVDADGEPLRPGRFSALARVLTLLDRGSTPVTCTVGIEPFAIDLSFDDLTVQLLRIVAGLEPDTLGSAASVWSSLTDNLVADAALDAAVASGACPAFDEAAQEGLDALDLLTAPEAAPLLRLITPVLETTEDHRALPHLSQVFGAIGSPQTIADVDALVARIGPTDDAAAAARGLQGLASPVPGGEPPLRHLLDLFAYALTGEEGVIGPPAVLAYPWVRLVVADPSLRQASGRLVSTWADPSSHVVDGTAHLPDEAPMRDGLSTVRALADEQVVEPLLAAAATDGAATALLADGPPSSSPLRALEAAIRGGTLSDALAWFEAASGTTGR